MATYLPKIAAIEIVRMRGGMRVDVVGPNGERFTLPCSGIETSNRVDLDGIGPRMDVTFFRTLVPAETLDGAARLQGRGAGS